MGNFSELSKRRQSCRDFSDKPVEHDKLVACAEAARLAPSGCNAQPWSFVVVESPAKVAEVAKAPQQNGMNPYAAGAKAFFVVLEEHATLMPVIACMLDSQYFAKGDLGAAVSYFCLEAADQGLETLQMGIFDRAAIAKALDLPAEKPIAALIAVGYPANSQIRPKVRKDFNQVVKFV